ncbi:MAG: tRNA (guanosine(46)-N7)-methyltransferase TrmB [Spirochaetales bacterium]|jgi:tRNA (guanine-N7-)-methyltransferase|nr:tRNA (guanosine(46)-N7)-methyltransferase TrmB [Spirochaetales bacterium]
MIFPIRSYVLRSRMTPAQKKAYEKYRDSGRVFTLPASVFPLEFSSRKAAGKLFIEIGFGMGRAIALMAERNPGAEYLGIEVHTPGVARLLWEIETRALDNISIIHADALPAVRDMIQANSVDGFHIFFPDPWPKKRHHKRRLINADFLRLLAGRLREGGYIYIVTDWEDYAGWIQEALAEVPELHILPGADIPWRPETAFEKKGRAAGRHIHEIFRVKSCINAKNTAKTHTPLTGQGSQP